jgi:hypothetical protein
VKNKNKKLELILVLIKVMIKSEVKVDKVRLDNLRII